MKTEHIVITGKESVIESIVKDSITFGFLIFCIWISKGSRAWTLICGIMFLIFVCAKAATTFGTRSKKFKTREELAAWASDNANSDPR